MTQKTDTQLKTDIDTNLADNTTGAITPAIMRQELTDIVDSKANVSAVPTALSGLTDDSTHRLVTDTEKSTWNGKQDVLGFTPVANTRTVNGYALSSDITISKSDISLENVDNVQQLPISYLDTDGTLAANSDTKVASQKATKNYADGKISKTPSIVAKAYSDSPYTVQSTDDIILVNSTSGSVTITLPATGRFRVKWSTGSNTVTVNVTNSGTIDGSSSYVLQTVSDCIEFVATTTGVYYII